MKPSGIITLITDFGISDPYVAMMKGVILALSPAARLVDITHKISVGSVSQAAGIIRETFSFFPEGTVHLGVVDPGVGSERRLLGLESRGHFFVGPDNGIFWPMLEDDKETRIVELKARQYFRPSGSHTFHGRDIFAPVAAHLSLGVELEDMGPPITDPVPLDTPKPQEKRGILYGQICRVDNFGNLISNISEDNLRHFLRSAQPFIEVGKLTIRELSRNYSEKDEGRPLALINSSNMLEIAVNLGRASEYIGIDRRGLVGTAVKVGKQA